MTDIAEEILILQNLDSHIGSDFNSAKYLLSFSEHGFAHGLAQYDVSFRSYNIIVKIK